MNTIYVAGAILAAGLAAGVWAASRWYAASRRRAALSDLRASRERLALDVARAEEKIAILDAEGKGHEAHAEAARINARAKLGEIREIDRQLAGLAAKYPVKR